MLFSFAKNFTSKTAHRVSLLLVWLFCSFLATRILSVSVPGDVAYNSSLKGYFSALEQEILPSCIVSPALAQRGVKFAISGGGHSLNANAANIDGGVTISLRLINSTSVNAEKNLVKIGGGAKWGEVYPTLESLGLATSGGRDGDVGIGGLATGGGISFFSQRIGWVCDNVQNFEVVLASGEIVNANKISNPDLFKALKGGSNNFGVVTRFDISAFPQKPFYGGQVISLPSTFSDQLSAFANIVHSGDPYTHTILSVIWDSDLQGEFVAANLQYSNEGVTNPPLFVPFTNVTSKLVDTMRVSVVSDFAQELMQPPKNRRYQFATTTFGGGFDLLKTVYQLFDTLLVEVKTIPDLTWSLSLQAAPRVTSDVGTNTLGLSSSDEPTIILEIGYNWISQTEDFRIQAMAKQFIADVDTAAKRAGYFKKFKYLNYATNWQDPIRSYGANSLKQLKAVGRKYDPKGLFQKGCPGGFKISKAGGGY
ncbi:hypothetical protein BJ875DRAFT_445599 [Amylocarpus encephaloides]|uniref:FAD-binding PCMH-type domain-containing protein n=1 Tax=Amylocarpus encephaloides TaxID=45428 RepID=A0A9P7Y9V7_9HELO|nr:hypothetical protein BJ875DRAFT_445599 [Amylocarpus encephaloides]